MNPGKKKYAIIVAGGSGTRMNSTLPKQFIPLAGKPLLIHTIQQFSNYSKDLRIILILPATQVDEWNKLCQENQFNLDIQIVSGGATRFQSVKNGLDAIDEVDGLVAIHDGVRPFIKKALIEESFRAADKYGSGIATVALKDSIRYVNEGINRAEDRTKFRLIQTPQTFQLDLIKKAYTTKETPDFTDDASVLEHSGERVHLIEGSFENIKITTPEDLIIAESILKTFTY